MKFFISREVKERFPDLQEVLLPVYNLSVKKGSSLLPKKYLEKLQKRVSEPGFFDNEMFLAFRQFYEELGVDTKRYLPSVENLYRRFKKTGRLPQINNVVDTLNMVALETLVCAGVFDAAKIKGDMVLRFTKEGEEFRPLGGGLEYLPASLVVIADEEKILNLYPYRDSIYPKITKKTRKVIILGDKVKGVSLDKTKKAVLKMGSILEKVAGGKVGKIFYSQIRRSSLPIKISDRVFKTKSKRKRVFSGTRPTGRLHLGNFLGGLKGYLALQERGDLDCIYSIVDLHAITSPFEPSKLGQNIFQVALDYLSAGLNPNKCHLMIQSQVPEHLELAYLLGTIYPVSRIEQLPTYKEKKLLQPKYVNVGLFYYPILMAADVLIYKGELVPVGVDQEPHLEVMREVARRFNRMFKPIFPEPQRFATEGESVPSLIGRGKMSKSVEGSYILLTDDLKTIKERLAKAPTDIGHGKAVPKEGGVANLLVLVELFMGKKARQAYEKQYLEKGIKYAELKERLAQAIYQELKPIQERRKYFEERPKEVEKILEEGRKYCSKIAQETLREAKRAMGLV